MSKTISILGSTGSIGRQTLDVAQQLASPGGGHHGPRQR